MSNNIKLPNPSKTSIFIQTLQWIVSPLSMMEERAKRYGDTFTMYTRGKATPVVFVSNPIALQEILTSDSTKQFSAPGNSDTEVRASAM